MSDKMINQLTMNEPEIYCYTIYGFLFSVAKEKDMPWIYSNFIQLMYHNDWKMPIFEDHINVYLDCPFLQSSSMRFKGDADDFTNTIIDAIDRNYYCYLFLDWYYINDSYHGDHFAHTAVISGYDRTKGVFSVYDNFDNGKFVKKEIPFDITSKAFFASKTSMTGNAEDNDQSDAFSYLSDIIFVNYNEFAYTKIDYNRIIYLLESYLNCENIIYTLDDKSSVYGMDVYNRLDKELKTKPYDHKKDLHLIYEHKLLMVKRLEKILDTESNSELIEEYKNFSQEFLILRNLYLKLCIKKADSEQMSTINTKLQELAIRDKEFMKRILSAVSFFSRQF